MSHDRALKLARVALAVFTGLILIAVFFAVLLVAMAESENAWSHIGEVFIFVLALWSTVAAALVCGLNVVVSIVEWSFNPREDEGLQEAIVVFFSSAMIALIAWLIFRLIGLELTP
jgi:hypothetical protein